MRDAMVKLSGLPFVRRAIDTDNIEFLSEKIKLLTDYYADFFQKLEFLPPHIQLYKHSLEGDYDFFYELSKKSDPVFRIVLDYLPNKNQLELKSAVPIHFNFSDSLNLHLLSGLAWVTSRKKIMLYLSGCMLSLD